MPAVPKPKKHKKQKYKEPIDRLPFDKNTHRGIKDISQTVDLGSEDELQKNCEDWLKAQKITYVHIGQQTYRNAKSKSTYKGIPDLLIFAKFRDHNMAHLVELKSLKGSARAGQYAWAQGLNVYLLRAFEDFKKSVVGFLEMVEYLEN